MDRSCRRWIGNQVASPFVLGNVIKEQVIVNLSHRTVKVFPAENIQFVFTWADREAEERLRYDSRVGIAETQPIPDDLEIFATFVLDIFKFALLRSSVHLLLASPFFPIVIVRQTTPLATHEKGQPQKAANLKFRIAFSRNAEIDRPFQEGYFFDFASSLDNFLEV